MEVKETTNYREILRLAEMVLSRTGIGTALGYSRNTVAEVLRRAQIKGIELPLPDNPGDWELGDMLFPEMIPAISGLMRWSRSCFWKSAV